MNQLKDESGQSVVILDLFIGLVAMGFLALALDVGVLSRQERMAQAAADAAALAAAEELSAGASSNEQAAANAIAKLNGFDTTLATNPAVVTLTTPNAGNYTGSAYVQATVSRPIPTMFLRAFPQQLGDDAGLGHVDCGRKPDQPDLRVPGRSERPGPEYEQ